LSTTNQDTSQSVQAPTSSALVASDISAWSAITRVVKDYLIPHKWRLFFAFSANLVVAATTSLVPAMIQIATAFLIWIETNKNGGKSTVETDLVDIPGVDTTPSSLPFGLEFSNADNGDIPLIYFICIGIVVVMGLKALATYISGVQLNYAGHKVVEKIQTQLFARLMRADLSWIQQTHSGRFISAFMSDAHRIRGTMPETGI
jgi:subfamily B ATP-binding cassette protein MsbA